MRFKYTKVPVSVEQYAKWTKQTVREVEQLTRDGRLDTMLKRDQLMIALAPTRVEYYREKNR